MKNPDVYLLYEYMEKLPLTVRMKITLDAPVDAAILTKAAQEAISRFPYFSVKVGLDAEQNYILEHNDKPIAVLPEKNESLTLGSETVNGHLFAITYRNNCVWFNFSHAFCGAKGALFWIKTTLYQYMTKQYGMIEAPKDIKLPGTPVTNGEMFFPNVNQLPDDEPGYRYEGGDTNLHLSRILKYMFNPFVKDNYYYQIEIPVKNFMEYAARVDGSPSTILTAMMYKVSTRMFKEKKDTFLSGRIPADYRNDIGANESYRDFVRFIHVKYEWRMKNESIEKLNMHARSALNAQKQPELSYERFKRLVRIHKGIDEQPNLKAKKKYASKCSTFRSDPRDTYTAAMWDRLTGAGWTNILRAYIPLRMEI